MLSLLVVDVFVEKFVDENADDDIRVGSCYYL